MQYGMLPRAMWLLFRGSFAAAAEKELGLPDGKVMMRAAQADYKQILAAVDEFAPDSRFAVNIMSCAMVIAVLRQLPEKPGVAAVTAFYRAAMCENRFMRVFLRKNRTGTPRGQKKLRRDAIASQTRNNPYDWKFTYTPGRSPGEYTATFTACGICALMGEHGYFRYVPALCSLDHDMARLSGIVFTREHTLAAGGPYCDCHYARGVDRGYHQTPPGRSGKREENLP